MTSSPPPTQKGKGQKPKSSRKSNMKAFRKNEGKGWKKPNAQANVGGRATSSQATKPSGCFIYNGPHRVRDCPRKDNAIIAIDRENNGSKALTRANPLQLLNVIPGEVTHKGLMYVELLTNGQKIVAMVDSRATRNFISTRETTRL